MIQVPGDMTEMRVMIEQLKDLGKETNENELIDQAVEDNAQAMLDEALEGHYYSAKLKDNLITIYDVLNEPVGTIKPMGTGFNQDFRENSDGLWLYMATELKRILGGR